MNMSEAKRKAAALLLCGFSAVSALLAQTTGDLRGTVKDPSGLVIVGATIKATLEGTSTSRTGTSDAKGDFFMAALPVGPYTVEIETAGFKKFIQHVEITLGHVAAVDAALEIGEMTQSVTAEAEAALVETTSTQLGAVMNSRAVVDLPLNTRDTYQLLQLQPGVQSQQGYSLFAGSDNAGVVSVNGGRGRANNFNVNGGDANDQFVAIPAVQPSPDTIEEFRVLTNTFDAEYGRNSGSVVNVVTKGGTNEFHGDLYEFFRNTDLDARGFFDTSKPAFHQNQFGGTLGGPIRKNKTFFFASVEDRQIVQGLSSDVVPVPTQAERSGDFSAGTPFSILPCNQGPCLNDDFLANALNQRPGCATAVAAEGGVPIASGTPWGAIFPNNQIPTQCFDATAAALMNRYVPLPNSGSGNYQASPNNSEKGIQSTFRLDQHLSDRHQLSFYYYFDNDTQAQPFSTFEGGGANLPGFGALYGTRDQQFNLSETWTATPTLVNEARFTYFREGQLNYNHPQNAQLIQNVCGSGVPASSCFSDPVNPQYGITPNLGASHEGVPYISVSGGFAIGNNFEGELPQIGNSFQWSDSLSKVMGAHSLKFGVDVRRMRFDQTLYYDVNGYYTVTGGNNDVGSDDFYPDYLLGLPNNYTQGSAQHENVRSTALYLFAQDSWKLRSNLTLNYGLRWELNTPLADIGKHVQTFRPGQVTSVYPCQLAPGNPLVQQFGSNDCSETGPANAVFPLGLVFPGDQGVPTGMTQTYYKAFAPRIGLAWSPSADSGLWRKIAGAPGKTSIRAGFGLFYNPIEQLVLEQFSAEPPFGGSTSLGDPMFNTPFVGQDGTVTPNPFNGILNPPRGQPVDWSSFRPILLYGQFQPKMRTQYSAQYNFTIQRELAGDVLFQIGYVGTQAHRLLATYDLNYGNAQTCLDLNALSQPDVTGDSSLACGPFSADNAYSIAAGEIPAGFTLHLPYGPQATVTGPNPNPVTLVGLRKYSSPNCNPLTGTGCPPDGVPVFSSIFTENTVANSNYNSLQVSAEKHFSHGLQFQAAYTFSKSIDNASSFENVLNPLNFRSSRALSLFDARNRLVFSYVYQFGRLNLHGLAGGLLNGWQSSGIVTFQSGFPVPITSSSDQELMDSSFFSFPGEPDQVAPLQRLNPRSPGNLAFNPADFQQPAQLGVIGDSPRSVCCGPGIDNIDFSLMKDTVLRESYKLEFRAEFFNVANHAQFSKVDGDISDGATFGKVLQTRDPRLVQFGLKLIF